MVLAILVLGLPEAATAKRRCATASSAPSSSAPSRRCSRSISQARLGKAGRRGLPALSGCTNTSAAATARRRGASRPSRGPCSACTPFWATVVKVELTDIVFAIDSILVAVAMSSKTLGRADRRHSRHRHDAARDRTAALARRAVSAARGRRVRDHRLGRHQAADRVPAQGRLHRPRDSAVGVARPHRRDLRRRISLRAPAGAAHGRLAGPFGRPPRRPSGIFGIPCSMRFSARWCSDSRGQINPSDLQATVCRSARNAWPTGALTCACGRPPPNAVKMVLAGTGAGDSTRSGARRLLQRLRGGRARRPTTSFALNGGTRGLSRSRIPLSAGRTARSVAHHRSVALPLDR